MRKSLLGGRRTAANAIADDRASSAAAPADAASAVSGFVDSPRPPTTGREPVRFEGWALDGDRAPARIDLVFNETTTIRARAGIDRPDVAANLQRSDAAAACGWAVTVDLSPFPVGELRVQGIAEDEAGRRSTFADLVYQLLDGPVTLSHTEPRPPRWDWVLPEFLAETRAEVNCVISAEERMPTDEAAVYLDVGRSALKAVRLAQMAAGKSDFASILDMPCGHGRVMRWLKAAYPDATFTACDLIADGVDFCATTFGATPVYSTPSPVADMFPDRYDLIFVGSLLTHVEVYQWDHLISLWHDLLAPDGVLVVSTHGELVAARMRAGCLYGFPAKVIKRALRAYEHSGFTFIEEAPFSVDYGITVARAEWTLARLLQHPDFRVVMQTEGVWDRHHDITAVVKRPLVPGA